MKKIFVWILVFLLVFTNIIPLSVSQAWAEEVVLETQQETDVPEPLAEEEIEVSGSAEEPVFEDTLEPTLENDIEDVIELEEPIIENDEVEPDLEVTEEVPVEEPLEEPVTEIVEEPADEPEANATLEESVEEAKDLSPLAVVAPLATNEYYTDDDSILLELTATSINEHTYAKYLWKQGDMIYVAVEMIQKSFSMTLNGVVNVGMYRHPAREPITVDGVNYYLTETHPNAYWSVFTFPLGVLDYTDPTQDYTVTMQGDGGHGITSSFTIVIPTVTVVVSKTWVDGPMTPVTIRLERMVEGGTWEHVVGMDVELTAENGQATHTWTDLPYVDNAGRIYTYRIVEADPGEGYDVSHGAPIYDSTTYTYTFALTNNYTSPKISVTATKVWSNGPISTEEVELQLYRNGVAFGESVTTTDLAYTWSDLDKTNEQGELYVYTVKEVRSWDNYESLITGDQTAGFTITNTYTSPLIDITVTKVWENGPITNDEVEVQLLRDGEAYGDPVTTTNLTYTWEDLDETDEMGEPYEYTVQEVVVPENYASVISGNQDDGFTITNTYTSPLIDVSVTKVWANGPISTDEVEVQLLRDGEAYGDPVMTTDLAYTWTDLDETDDDGKAYVYTVVETGSWENYESLVTGDQTTGFTITNTYTSPLIDIMVTKVWENGPISTDEVEVQLLRDGEAYGDPVMTTNLTYTWIDLDETDEMGVPYEYTVKEVEVPENYESVISGDQAEGFTINNTYTSPLIDVSVTKVWANGPISTDEVEVQLLRDGEAYGDPVMTTDLAYTWTDLDETDDKGVPYVYTVEEPVLPDNYAAVITGTQEDGFSITNTYTSPLIDVTVTKVWVNGPTVRPEIDIQLFRDGEPFGEVITLKAGETSYTWKDLDETDDMGVAYVYTADEVLVPANYEKTISEDGLTITNTYVPPLIDIDAEKVWYGGPEDKPEIMIELLRGIEGETPAPIEGLEPRVPDENGLITWTDLPETDINGNVYIYVIREVTVPPLYEAEYSVGSDGTLVVTNKFIGQPKIELVKEADKETFTKVGEIITYTITVTNTGDAKLENIVVTDPMFPDLETEITSLLPGESFKITLEHKVTEADIKAGKVYNAASVTADSPETPDKPEVDSEDEVTVDYKPTPTLPNTGMGSNVGLLAIGLGLLGTTVFLFFKRRREE